VKADREREGAELPPGIPDTGEAPGREMERALAVSVVRNARQEARRACESKGLASHWEVFIRHEVEGVSYAELALELGHDPARLRRMLRTAKDNFRGSRCARS